MIVTFVSEKGGVGKSTLAVSVASQWMSRGRRVLLVDADPQGTGRIACLEAREQGNLAPDCVEGNLRMRELVARFSPAYEHIIIDTPGRAGDMQRAALLCADVALIPVAPTPPDVWALARLVEMLQQVRAAHAPRLRAALVMAKLLRGTCLAAKAHEYLEPVGLPIFKASTTTRTAWAETLSGGGGVAQYEPKSVAADELRALVAELERFAVGRAHGQEEHRDKAAVAAGR